MLKICSPSSWAAEDTCWVMGTSWMTTLRSALLAYIKNQVTTATTKENASTKVL